MCRIGNGFWRQEETAETRPHSFKASIDLIFYRMWGLGFDKLRSPVSISFQQRAFCVRKNIPTCGVDSMSRLQEHIFPSVETVMRLWAFWVPTTLTQYTGCCKSINREDQVQLQQDIIMSGVKNMTLKQDLKRSIPTRIQALVHLPLLIWAWFFSQLSGGNT